MTYGNNTCVEAPAHGDPEEEDCEGLSDKSLVDTDADDASDTGTPLFMIVLGGICAILILLAIIVCAVYAVISHLR